MPLRILSAALSIGVLLSAATQATATTVHRVAAGGDVGATLQRAAPGDVIELAPGRYPRQVLRRGAATGAPVVIRPRAGRAVRFDYMEVRGSRLDVRNITTGGWYVHPGSRNITMRRVHAVGGGTFITSARNVRLIGGSVRNVDSVDGLQVKAASGGPEPSGIRLERFTISGVTREDDPSRHTECIQVTAVRGMVIRDSVFARCSTQGVFLKEGLGGEIDRVLVENSWFGRLSGYYTLIFRDGVSNAAARFNIFAQSPRLGGGRGARSITAVGNVGRLRACGDGVTYRNNRWSDARCGRGDVRAAVPAPFRLDRPPRWTSIRRVGVAPGRVRQVGMRVRPGRGALTFMVRADGRPRLGVAGPSGRPPARSRRRGGAGYSYVTVADPAPGVWRLRVAAPGSRSPVRALVTAHR